MDSEEKAKDQSTPSPKKLVSPSGKHLLHRLPTFSGPTRIAQSKASAKEQPTEDEVIKVVPVAETLKETPPAEPIEEPSKDVKLVGKDEDEVLDAPAESAVNGNHLPAVEEKLLPVDEKDEKMDVDESAGIPTPAPVKKQVRRSVSTNSNTSKNDSDGDDGLMIVLPVPDAGPPPQQDNAAAPAVSSPTEGGEKKKKKNRHKLSSEEIEKPSEWLVGDLVWSKVSGHPWWPCMISYDPIEGLHTKLSGIGAAGGRHKLHRSYHVQYFGARAERSWSRETAIIEFKGKDAFAEQVKGHRSSGANKYKNPFELAPAKKAPWNIAIEEANDAMKMSRNERKSQLTFQYTLPKKKRPAPTSASGRNTPENRPKEKKIRKSTDSISPKVTDISHAELMNGLLAGKKKKRLSEPQKKIRGVGATTDVMVSSGFEMYFEKNAKRVKAENPKFTDDAVKQYLQHHWIGLSHDQKQQYEGTVILEDQGGRRLSARVKKPSKKVLEAVEDMSAEDNVVEEPAAKKKRSPESQQEPSTSKPEGPRRVEDTLDDTINCYLYGDDYQKAIKEEIVEKKETKEKKVSKLKKPAAVGRAIEAKKIGGVRKVPRKVMGPRAAQKTPKRSRKRKRPESDPFDTTDLDSQDEIVEKPKVKRRKMKDDASSTSSEGERVKLKHRDDVSDTDSLGSKKGKRGVKVETPTESESDPMEYQYETTDNEDLGKPGAFTYKPGKVCQICEKPEDLIQCEGSCLGSFHPACLGLTDTTSPSEFKCDECLSGVHTCFICKKTEKETRRCSIPMCGKFYHEDCLKLQPQARIEGKTFVCSLHGCATCYANNPKSIKANKGRLVRCTRCPTAYHAGNGDYCVAGGCEQLSSCSMICSKHFKPDKKAKHHSHVNVSWCFSCSRGGTLLCCEGCPASFHAACLDIEFPDGSWFCNSCASGKKPLYGDIVWVKLGNYRWWPAVICHPRNVPKNIQDKKHQVGEFPVHFFGSNDYFWTHQRRVFLFQDGDKGSRETANTKRLEAVFKNAVLEASDAFQKWKILKELKEQQASIRIGKKPPPYKYTKVNVPVGNAQVYKADLTTLPRCECTDEMACSKESNCLNRVLMYECHPSLCPAGEKCQNQRFQKRQYPEAVPYKTPGRGWGLKTRFDIKKGQFVNEYVGELIDEEECRRRIEKAHDENFSSFYLLTLDSKRVIDAGPKGNLSRFMNHSCEPNCVTQKWNVNGDVRVGLFAVCDIPAGAELTFNYNLDCLGNDKMPCQCGAPRCSGFIGVPPKSASSGGKVPGKEERKKKKKKRKLIHKPKHEDDCFRCGEGGTLVMCDLPGCVKAYHMDCLTLDKLPYGKWICPWHHCDECGKKAVRKCVECPNSFCIPHAEGHITEMADGKLFCDDHEDVIEAYALAGSSTSATSSEGETNSEETASEDAGPVMKKTEALDQNTTENQDQPMDIDNIANNIETPKIDTQTSDTQDSSATNSSDGEGKIKKKGRGRPRKSSSGSDKSNSATNSSDGEGKIKKKGRGRPRKESSGSDKSNSVTSSSDGEGNIKKKGRGRPRKDSSDSDKSVKKPAKLVSKLKGVKPRNPSGSFKKVLKKKKEKKLKAASRKEKKGKGQRTEGEASENNNDMKIAEQTTDDDEFPSLVIDIPGC